MFTACVDTFGDEIDLVAALLVEVDQFAGDPFWDAVFVEFIVHFGPKLAELALIFFGLQVGFADGNAGGNDGVAVVLCAPLKAATGEESGVVDVESGDDGRGRKAFLQFGEGDEMRFGSSRQRGEAVTVGCRAAGERAKSEDAEQ